MYVVFGDTIVDSKEIRETIEINSEFKVLRDMSKSSKREDIVAFNISLDVNVLKDIIEEDGYDTDSEDDIINEYMQLSDEIAIDLEEYMPEGSLIKARSYKYDQSDQDIKMVIAICNEELGELKLNDVIKRLLRHAE
ncbi:MAG TPA: hypothetical protein VLM81_00960 [Peptostreptococcaceae bacterium]|nr:hypothetical protein [Peptostreptococcaceae bacterium]